ncbi:MAG: reverse transcriptase family protein [Mesoflavibacter sp.]|nr:reverse transcriptase family protein [Mesoflavibacter sp.]
MANNFNQQYTPPSDKKPEQIFRNTLRNMKKISTSPVILFTTSQTAAAIKKAKNSKAVGPDGLSPIMLKNLGPHGIKFLTVIFNKSLKTTIIPTIWKTAKIIPLLKPGKPANLGTSYRPVSLLSPAAKIFEALLLPHVTTSIDLANHQHGFRKGRSTTTALQSILEHINKGLNMKKPVHRTVSVAIDLSKAFDTVDHQLLLNDINNLPLNDYIIRFLCAYLRGRYTYVFFRNAKSKNRKVKQGVPQGGVLSPILFNLYMASMPPPPGKIKIVSYADDGNLLNSGPKIEPLVKQLNIYLSTLNNWFKSRNLFISPSKSSATLFTTSSNEVKTTLKIKIDGETVPTVKKPKILGITFDNLLSFRQHAQDLKSKLNSKNNILKALSGSNWGKDKEVMITTYKAISQSVLNYCCPIWTPSLSATSWQGLQTAQNAALRIATGCHLMTDIDHLHHETKVMKVKPHCDMLSQQFLLATQRPDHPNRIDLTAPPPPRQMKKTLASTFGDKIKRISVPDISDDQYKKRLKDVHTSCVRDQILNMAPNKVLQATPPKISETEKTLPRTTRTTLAQLRSGYSNYLNSYKARISQNQPDPVSDLCPLCNAESHTTTHLFSCPNNPTTLTVRDLWSKPLEAARFLNLARNDDDPG